MFFKFDRDGNGSLSREEFLYALDKIVINLEENQKLIILVDYNVLTVKGES